MPRAKPNVIVTTDVAGAGADSDDSDEGPDFSSESGTDSGSDDDGEHTDDDLWLETPNQITARKPKLPAAPPEVVYTRAELLKLQSIGEAVQRRWDDAAAGRFDWWFDIEFSLAECEEFLEEAIDGCERCVCGDVSRPPLPGAAPCWLDDEIKLLEFATEIAETAGKSVGASAGAGTASAGAGVPGVASINVDLVDVGRGHRLVAPRAQRGSSGPYVRLKSVLVSVRCCVELADDSAGPAAVRPRLEQLVRERVESGDIIGRLTLADGADGQVAPERIFFRKGKKKKPASAAAEKFSGNSCTRPKAFDSHTIWRPKMCKLHGPKEPLRPDSATSPIYGPLHAELYACFDQQAIRVQVGEAGRTREAYEARKRQVEDERQASKDARAAERQRREDEKIAESLRRQLREEAADKRRADKLAREQIKAATLEREAAWKQQSDEERRAQRDAESRARQAILRAASREAEAAEKAAAEALRDERANLVKAKIARQDEHAKARSERTENARTMSRIGVQMNKEREQRRIEREDNAVVLETLRIEQTRSIEGQKRTRQGRKAIDWGGTEEANAARNKQRLREERTKYARAKSMDRVISLKEADLVAAREEDEKAILRTLRIEQTRAIEGEARRREGKLAIDWGGTDEAQCKAEKERIRAEKTEIARKKSKMRVKAMKTAALEMQQAADETVVLETLRIEQSRAIEGAKRTRQGRQAIDWGGTEEAEYQRQKQEIRARKTEIARLKSSLKVKALAKAKGHPIPEPAGAWYPSGAWQGKAAAVKMLDTDPRVVRAGSPSKRRTKGGGTSF